MTPAITTGTGQEGTAPMFIGAIIRIVLRLIRNNQNPGQDGQGRQRRRR
jgi:hypothetical protein